MEQPLLHVPPKKAGKQGRSARWENCCDITQPRKQKNQQQTCKQTNKQKNYTDTCFRGQTGITLPHPKST